ncbi:MAG: MYXO-CTERM sorting domain-containing protein [Polyangiaceae bacterium]|nr:MYXO-CTERM sorting domain-containing protein [Polyangiaceae bacterium]
MRGWAWFALLALPACGGDRDDGFVVSPPGAKPDQVRVAATATGTSLLTYARYDGAAEFRSSRVRARTLNFAELPDAGSDADADAAIADAAGPDGAAGQGGSATDDTRRVPLEPVGGCGCRASAALPAFGCTWFFSALTLAAIRRRRRRARERVACAP